MSLNGTKNFLLGFVVGIGTGIIAREIAPNLQRGAKPFAKQSMKWGISIFAKTREGLARMGETMEDLTEEVKAELKDATEKEETVATAEAPTSRRSA